MFRIYDDDDNNEIGKDNLLRCAQDLGEEVNEQEIDMMIKMADSRNSGSVDIDDFMKLMRTLGLLTD